MKNNLKKLRLEKKLTLKRLAELTGFAFQTIGNYENDRFDASDRMVQTLAKALNVTPSEIDPNYKPPEKSPDVKLEFIVQRSLSEALEAVAQAETRSLDNLLVHICVEYLRRHKPLSHQQSDPNGSRDGGSKSATKQERGTHSKGT